MRIPLPPPPFAALTIRRIADESLLAAGYRPTPGLDLVGARDDRQAGFLHRGLRALSLSPISRMISGDGPMKVSPQASHTSAK